MGDCKEDGVTRSWGREYRKPVGPLLFLFVYPGSFPSLGNKTLFFQGECCSSPVQPWSSSWCFHSKYPIISPVSVDLIGWHMGMWSRSEQSESFASIFLNQLKWGKVLCPTFVAQLGDVWPGPIGGPFTTPGRKLVWENAVSMQDEL